MKSLKEKKLIITVFLIVIVVSSISFSIYQENKRQSEIKKQTATKHISYIKQFEKENPDIAPMIKRNNECLSQKVKPQGDCKSYVYKDTTPSQQLKYRSYLEELQKIRMEFARKMNNK